MLQYSISKLQHQVMQADRQVVSLHDFAMLSQIGIGNYAKVILVRKKDNGKVYAMKIVKKKKQGSQIKGIKKQHAYIEKQILFQCNHPFIVKMHSTFQRQKKLYFVLEYCPGGELFGLIRRMKRFSEQSVKFYTAQILLAIEYLHSEKLIYRDLKPENVLIDKMGYIKVVDFGLSCRMNQVDSTDLIAGTPEYLPPQTFQKGRHISSALDWWTLGNIIFEMVMGFPPFFIQHQTFQIIKQKIINEEPPLYFISNPLLKDLLQRLLIKNPHERLGANGSEEVKSHGWFYGTNWQGLLKYQLTPPFKPQIKNDADTRWFQFEQNEMSPPESSNASEKGIQRYPSFSSSWKSSRDMEVVELETSPPQILVNISESSPK